MQTGTCNSCTLANIDELCQLISITPRSYDDKWGRSVSINSSSLVFYGLIAFVFTFCLYSLSVCRASSMTTDEENKVFSDLESMFQSLALDLENMLQ